MIPFCFALRVWTGRIIMEKRIGEGGSRHENEKGKHFYGWKKSDSVKAKLNVFNSHPEKFSSMETFNK